MTVIVIRTSIYATYVQIHKRSPLIINYTWSLWLKSAPFCKSNPAMKVCPRLEALIRSVFVSCNTRARLGLDYK